jgi:hypothetical protein
VATPLHENARQSGGHFFRHFLETQVFFSASTLILPHIFTLGKLLESCISPA